MNIPVILAHYECLPSGFVGRDAVILCPFHDDGRPSCNVSLADGQFLCFACGARGDIVRLVSGLEETNTLLASLAIVGIPGYDSESAVASTGDGVFFDEKAARAAIRSAFDFYRALPLPDWKRTKEHYLFDRGLTPETLEHFGVRINPTSTRPIVIPLVEDGRFKGYVSRAVDETVVPKYKNNYGYRRSQWLIGPVEPKSRVLVVEGIMDMMKAYQYGAQNVVALLGWQISAKQVEKLLRLAPSSIVNGLDSDVSGEKGTLHLQKVFSSTAIPVERLSFPAGCKDIGEMERKQFLYRYFFSDFSEIAS